MAVHAPPIWRRPWVVPAIFLLALGLRIALMLFFPQEPRSDGEFYMLRAAEMARGMGYQEAGHPTAFWPVGYPALLALAMSVVGPGMVGPMFLNLAAAALILWLILWFGRTLGGGELAARAGALLYALYPAHIAYTGAPLSETVATAVTMAAFALLIARRHQRLGLIAAGLLFGAATLMRTQTLLFPAGALILLMLAYRDFGWRDAVKAGLVVYLALLAAILPWSVRNSQELGTLVLVSTNGGVALHAGANDLADGNHMAVERTPLWADVGVPWDQRVQRQIEVDRRLRTMATDWIAAHPGRWLALGPRKMLLLWRQDTDGFWSLHASHPAHERSWWLLQWLNQAYYVVLLGLALACFWTGARAVLRRDETQAPLILLAATPIFVTILAFFFTGQVRYHYPAMPFVIVAAGWTIARLAAARGLRSTPRGLPIPT